MKGTASVFVVDDEQANFDVIEILLFQENYELSYAASGFAALAQLEQLKPDVILLDVMMPGLSGVEVCQQIKANPLWQHIPIIIVTALNSKEDLARCLEAGADDFVSKPVNGIEIRARVRSMLRIKRQYDDLQALLQLREDMVNMLVHDLRNPLTSITLTCSLMEMAPSSDKLLEKVEDIALAGQQLESMIDDLLVMAKLQSGKLPLNYTEVDLCALGTSVISDFEPIAAQKNIRLVSYLPTVGGCVALDPSIFRRILDNLLSNAIKFSPYDSQIILRIEYLLRQKVRIQVLDSGPGVSKELRQQIFEKYEVGALFRGISQTGLGLAFCKLAVDAHHGKIIVENNQPVGSIFTVEI